MKNIPKKLLLLVLTLVIGITLVACGNNKDEEAVKKAITETTVQTEVSENFDLPAKSGDVTIVWTVEGNGLALGTVADDKQPVTVTQTDSDQSATLKATFKLNEASDTKTYPVKVKAKVPVGKTDAEKVADAITKVTVAGEVTANFELPTKQDEVGITWTVTGAGLALGTAANNKLPVTVTRTDADQTATLKATFSLGSATDTKEFTVKVVKLGDIVEPETETAKAYYDNEGAEKGKNFEKNPELNQAALINLDPTIFEVYAIQEARYGNAIGLSATNEIRLYADRVTGDGNELIIIIKEGYEIISVEYSFKSGNNSPFMADLKLGSTKEALKANDIANTRLMRSELSINGFSLKNSQFEGDSSTQIWIEEINIVYKEGTPESILGGGDVDPELTDQEKVNLAIADVNFANKELREDTTLDLLKKGLHDVAITWEATTGEEYINLETGKVTLPTTPGTYDLVLEATFKLGDVVESFEYTFELIVPEVIEDDFIIHEGFEDADLPSSYGNNTFIGNKDVVFTYSGARDEDTFGIENKGILFRGKTGDHNPSLNFTVNGLSLLYFEYRKAFTGGTGRQLELYINDELVQTTDLFGAGSGDQKDVYTFIYDKKHLEEVNVSIRVATNGQVTIDNLYVYGPEAEVPKLHTVNFDTVDRDVEILDGTQVRLPDAPTTPENYEFVGWELEGVLYDFDLPVTTDLNLLAKFDMLPEVTVKTLDDLLLALANENVGVINLGANITTNETILIDRNVIINGGGFTIEMPVPVDGKWQSGNAYILHVYDVLNVEINNIKLIGGNAGLLVNGSVVAVTDITLENHTHGGIEVSHGEFVDRDPQLTVTGELDYILDENVPVIWIDGKTTNDLDWVSSVEGLKEVPYTENGKEQLWFVFDDISIALVKDLDELLGALDNTDVETIILTADIITENTIVIHNEVTIQGEGFSITMTGERTDWVSGNAFVLQAYLATNVVIENLTVKGGNAGLLVNGSKVTVENLVLEGQTHGGIEVSQGISVDIEPKLTVLGTLVYEVVDTPPIWIDGKTENGGWVVQEGLTEEINENQLWFVEPVDPIERQFHETFDASPATTQYADGTFTGVNGVVWTYVHSRNEALGTSDDSHIDGKGIMLRRADEPSSLSATFTNGIGEFSFEYRKAFTGGTARKYAVDVTHNGTTTTYDLPEFGSGSGQQDDIYDFTQELNLEGEVVIKIYATGAKGNQQATFDNFAWTEHGDVVEPVVKHEVSFNSDGGSIVEPQTINEGSKATKPVDPTKEGFNFLGWFIGKNEFDFDTLITEAITLTAHWEEAEPEEPGDEVEVTTEYIFTSNSWGTSQDDWTSGKGGNQYQSGRGIQVTSGASGANGTTKITFYNVKSIEITYSTNASKGVGTIVTKVGNETVQTFTVSTTGGTTNRSAGVINVDSLDGAITITINCTTNSIYLYGIKIVHTES